MNGTFITKHRITLHDVQDLSHERINRPEVLDHDWIKRIHDELPFIQSWS